MPQPSAPASPVAEPAVAGAPISLDAFQGLRARRELLTQQLAGVGDRRGELARELANTSFTEGAARRGLEQRLQVLDGQVVQLERDIATTDRQLAAAPHAVLAQTEQRPRETEPTMPEDDAVGIAFGAFFFGVFVTLLGGRLRRWRRRRAGRVERGEGERGVGPDPRIDRLTHAVDAIALEVERIGEGQRFVTQLLAEGQGVRPALAAEAGRPLAHDAERTLDAPAVR